ncbi:MAG: (Fe-S)-binding protein [Gammaproteobacteria bacterium]|nr:(Fe-S)-binding protein [Gammaproteobacteria bacterium]NNJ84867.1 (Fe-S)-binding protein [Gammaproteobacteria bacterium]
MNTHTTPHFNPRVGFFVTCLVNFFRPTVGFAGVKLLSNAGCQVAVPEEQTCCGQFAYNSGDIVGARALARQVITRFEGFEYIIVPSGSCAHMLKGHYPDLFAGDPEWESRARQFSERCFELTSFLVDICPIKRLDTGHEGVVTYHDSCVGLRKLGIRAQPRVLLQGIEGLEIREMAHPGVCCGFGGAFCIKYPEISTHIVTNKVTAIHQSGANNLLGGDLGCLLNIAGRLKRMGSECNVYHVAEVLAGVTLTDSDG